MATMARNNIKKTNKTELTISLKRCEIYKGVVTGNSDSCDKVHVPLGWKGRTVFVVYKDGN